MVFIYGTAGNDSLDGTDGADLIQGLGGDDTLNGAGGADVLFGHAGSDVFLGGQGNDTMYGGGGLDIVQYQSAPGPIEIDLGAGIAAVATQGTDVLDSIEGVIGSAFADLLTGDGRDNWFRGGAGDDTIEGGEGIDTADYRTATGAVLVNLGAAGGPQVSGADGNDVLTGIENVYGSAQHGDVLTGDAGDNILRGRGGDDTLDGGAGFDTADYGNATAAVHVSLAAGTSSGADGNDALSNFEAVVGSSYADTLTGDGGANRLSGNGGNDTLEGGSGDDTIDGGAGSDSAYYTRAGAAVTVDLAAGTATGGAGTDTLVSIENVRGSDFADRLTGDGSRNFLTGGAGNDTIDGAGGVDLAAFGDADAAGGVSVDLAAGTATGASGSDTLLNIEGAVGSINADTILGSAGDDYIEGRGGADTLVGGAGFDTLMFWFASGAVSVNLATGAVSGVGDDDITGFEAVSASNFGDTVAGDGGDNRIEGRGGDDTLDGGAGFDTVSYAEAGSGVTVDLAAGTATGGAGSDTLANFEAILGSEHGDTLLGNAGANLIQGAGGDDLLGGRGGVDTFDGGAGFDFVSYSAATAGVTIDLAAGQATAGAATSTLIAIEGVYGSAYADRLTGDANGNILRGNGGADTIDGGAGIDYADYSAATAAVDVNLAAGTASGGDGADTLIGIEGVRGSGHGDRLVGDSGANFFRPMGGDDSIDGGLGDDTIEYRQAVGSVSVDLGLGRATKGGSGDDDFVDSLASIEFATGSQYDDLLVGSVYVNVFRGLDGDDTIRGGLGVDLVDYVEAGAAVDIDLRDGFAVTGEGRDTLDGIEGLYGTSFDDRLVGDAGDNIFRGRGGADTIDGGEGLDIADYADASAAIVVDLFSGERSGAVAEDTLTSIEGFYGTAFADRLIGDAADNVFRGGAGVDTLDGGAGVDSLDYRNASAAVSANLSTNSVLGADGNDVIANFENVGGSAFADRLTGDEGVNTLRGRAGDDTIDGGAGIDTARYDGLQAWFDVTVAAGLPTTVADATGEEGVDLLAGIERLRFVDLNLGFDIEGVSGMAYRIYKAAFDRAPDLAGLGYWIDALDDGATPLDMAYGFLVSDEFQDLYGTNPTNEEYTLALYLNVLDREPDDDGYAYWNARLNDELWNGIDVPPITREQMLVDFSESVENKANVLPLIENGVQYELWLG